MKIMVAVDDSPYSKSLIATLTRRKWPKDVQFMVVTVLEPVCIGGEDDEMERAYLEDMNRKRYNYTEKFMDKICKKLEPLAEKGKVSKEIKEGSPKSCLIETAKTWKAEKIIMGAHGRGTCPHFLIGSVSKAVAASAPCTVEVIRIADKN